MTKQQIITDIKHHGIITASVIHNIKIDTLIVIQRQGENNGN